MQQHYQPSGQRDVVLVSMPFGPLRMPSLGLSLLKAGLNGEAVSSEILYFTFAFAEQIGVALYDNLADGHDKHLPGEWLFSSALAGHERLDPHSYLEAYIRPSEGGEQDPFSDHPWLRADELHTIYQGAGDFIERCAATVLARRPRILGFTSTFFQNVASLALAQRLKALAPDLNIVFGGANCEGAMGAQMLRSFPFIDAVVSGEGDQVFPVMVTRLLAGESIDHLQGVFTAANQALSGINGVYPNTPLVRDMDSLPYPDFTDFFAQLHAIPVEDSMLSYESSRGCWWGERQHCTFCGLNGTGMAYRAKSADRALEELLSLSSTYPADFVAVADNILSQGYFRDFIPRLAQTNRSFGLFYEVKANLKKEQLRALRAAGIEQIQPGIESLSDEVLGLMRKGVSAMQNIQLLKWCRELGMRTSWNLLYGFAGEDPAEYQRMAELIPLLSHLPAPHGAGVIHTDRFSPNFDHPEEFGLIHLRPPETLRHIYDLPEEALYNLCYHFEHDYLDHPDPDSYTELFREEVTRWVQAYPQSELFFVELGDLISITDMRPIARSRTTLYMGLEKLLYVACDEATSLAGLGKMLAESGAGEYGPEQLEALLQPMLDAGLMLRFGGRFLSLAIPVGVYRPHTPATEWFGEVVSTA